MSDQRVPIPGSELQARVAEHWLPDDSSTQTLTASILLRRPLANTPSEQDLLSGHYQAPSREAAATALAADPKDLADVRSFVQQYGLKIVDESSEARRIQVQGTVEQMDKAFGVQLKWANDDNGHHYLTYTGAITVPKALSGVVTAVLGLDGRPVARHHSQ